MHKKTLYIALVAFLAFNSIDARKTRRGRRPKEEEEENSTPQPNVVTYSTFGFNDVNSYDGFVPSSPNYESYLSTNNKESSTRLYAPAFPTALDSEYRNGYGSQPQDTQSFRLGDDSNAPQASMLQYAQSSMGFYNPGLESEPKSEQGAPEEIYGRNSGDIKGPGPIYGAKLSSKNRNKFFNASDFNGYSGAASDPHSDKYFDNQPTYESKPASYGEPSKNYQSNYNNNNYQTYSPLDVGEPTKQEPTQPVSYKFPKVVDFTKYKQYYPTELDNKYMPANSKPTNTMNYEGNNPNKYSNNYDSYNGRYTTIAPPFKSPFNNKDKDDEMVDKEVSTLPTYTDTNNYFGYNNNNKDESKVSKSILEFKDKFKYKPWTSVNYTNDHKNPIKGYQYSTNFSNMNFEFDFSGSKQSAQHQPITINNTDEYVPASSNHIDYSAYQFPESDYSNSPYSSFKKIPSVKGQNDDYASIASQLKYQDYNYDPVDYVKSLYSTPKTTTTTSSWGNVFKNSEYSYSKYHPKRPSSAYFGEDAKDEVVHIGSKRPYSTKYNYGKYSENKQLDWPSYNGRPLKSRKPFKDVDDEVSSTRYKNEVDLLGLRTHDTSHPSYLPTRPSGIISDEYDYKKLVEKWRQSYLRSKYKDAFRDSPHDFESYPSEMKPVHVPIPKPYPIEIPHPVIVPVPQPYPVRVPIPKPVAVPVVQEITIPVEKPVPYAVYKKVPYPVEKPVPVRVEKEVKVGVVKPYPIHVPSIRPVFHHTRPQDDMDAAIDIDEEHDYMPRPDSSKKIQYAKRIRGSRNRTPRRPSRARPSYPERNRQRWPVKSSDNRRKPVINDREHSRYSRRPGYSRDHQVSRFPPAKPQDFDVDDFDNESDYLNYVHCKRSGHC